MSRILTGLNSVDARETSEKNPEIAHSKVKMIWSRILLIFEDKCRASSGSHEIPTKTFHVSFHTPETRSNPDATSLSWQVVTNIFPSKNRNWEAWKTRNQKLDQAEGTNHQNLLEFPENMQCQNIHTADVPADCHIMQRSQRFASISRPIPNAMAEQLNFRWSKFQPVMERLLLKTVARLLEFKIPDKRQHHAYTVKRIPAFWNCKR